VSCFIRFNDDYNKLIFVGGYKALASEFPHQALLGYVEETKIKWRCGGSIISSDFILTGMFVLN
jgi:hypothetical protein